MNQLPNSFFCRRPCRGLSNTNQRLSPYSNAARTLCTSKGLRLVTKLNPSLLANRTPSASNKPLPTDGLFPAHTLDLSLSAVQRCRPGWAGPRRHSCPAHPNLISHPDCLGAPPARKHATGACCVVPRCALEQARRPQHPRARDAAPAPAHTRRLSATDC